MDKQVDEFMNGAILEEDGYKDWLKWASHKERQNMWHAPKLFNGLKCEFKPKTVEEQGVEARSLVCNTLGVEGRVRVLGWD